MFKLKIDTRNDAFQGNETEEIVRILREVIQKLESGRDGGYTFDINGNRVGEFKLN